MQEILHRPRRGPAMIECLRRAMRDAPGTRAGAKGRWWWGTQWDAACVLLALAAGCGVAAIRAPSDYPTSAGAAANARGGRCPNSSCLEDCGVCPPVDCTPSYGSYHGGNWPPACFHPYDPASWHNTPLPANPRVDLNSAAIVAALSSHGAPDDKSAGAIKDFDHPIYWSIAADPIFRLASCGYSGELTGASFHALEGMLPGGGSDGHLTVIDQSTNTEWDFWRAAVNDRARTISASACGRLSIFGDGRILSGTGHGDGGNAANTGLYTGQIRAVEIEAGIIEHPIAIIVFCTSRRYVFPASGRATSCGGPDEPADGQFFQLTYTNAEIDALNVPAWKKVILHAMRRYGFYVDDTGAGSAQHPASMAFHFESDKMFQALGYEDPFVTYAKQHLGEDIYSSHGVYYYQFAPGVDWSRIQVIAPCVIERRC